MHHRGHAGADAGAAAAWPGVGLARGGHGSPRALRTHQLPPALHGGGPLLPEASGLSDQADLPPSAIAAAVEEFLLALPLAEVQTLAMELVAQRALGQGAEMALLDSPAYQRYAAARAPAR